MTKYVKAAKSFETDFNDFKKVVYSLNNELNTLIGEVNIMFVIKKVTSIGNTVVKNVVGINRNKAGCRQCRQCQQQD